MLSIHNDLDIMHRGGSGGDPNEACDVRLKVEKLLGRLAYCYGKQSDFGPNGTRSSRRRLAQMRAWKRLSALDALCAATAAASVSTCRSPQGHARYAADGPAPAIIDPTATAGRWGGRTYLLDGYHRAVRFWKTQPSKTTFGVYVPLPDR